MQEIRVGSELGRYRIESLLGRGGMSRVYLAENTRLHRQVALKILAPELAEDPVFRERFVRESQLAASLGHPNIVPVYEADEANGVFFIAMQYVEGSDLSSFIRSRGRLTPREVLPIIAQVAQALDAAHARELVHRDVKPANILVAPSADPTDAPRAYLADFGITKRSTVSSGLTSGGQFVGTVDYVAPEQIRGEPLDGRTDEYSLGCVLFECLTGSVPFARDNEIAVLWAHLNEPAPAITTVVPALPVEVEELVSRALAKSPDDRFPRCVDLAHELGAVTRASSVPSVEPYSGPPIQALLVGHPDDHLAIDSIAARLNDHGIRAWVRGADKPDTSHPSIAAALKAASVGFFCIGPSGLGDLEREEIRLAREASTTRNDFSLVPILLPGLPDVLDLGLLPPFLASHEWLDLRSGVDDEESFAGLLDTASGVAPRRISEDLRGICPYRGLQAFDEDHARFFFGRDADVQRLLEKLKASPFLAVVGPSGSGKSSLVRAGLVPAIRAGALAGSERWDVHVLKPGSEPLTVAAAHLLRSNPELANEPIVDRMRADEQILGKASKLAASMNSRSRVLWVIDQFEELFTLCRDEREREAFISNLLHACTPPGGTCRVVLTLRADFYSHCASYPALAEFMSAHQYLVSPMSERALRAAIVQPARLVGLSFDEGLADTILSDAGRESGSLPLLEHALLEVWERSRDGRMTLEGYRDAGGVEGALAKRADTVYASFGQDQQAIVRRILLRLTEPGEGTEDTRRRVEFSELVTEPGDRAPVEAVLEELVRARLLTSTHGERADRSVEVAHEALIRGWPHLRNWIEEDRAGLLLQRRLTEAAREWSNAKEDESRLFRGARLAEAQEWLQRSQPALNELERRFLTTSVEVADRERAEAERRTQRELEDARQIAGTQRRAARLLRGLAIVLILGLAGSSIATVVARRQSRVSRSRELAAASTIQLEQSNPELGALLAVEAAKAAHTPQAEVALHRALLAINVLTTFRGHSNPVIDVDLSADGNYVMTRAGHIEAGSGLSTPIGTANGDHGIRIWIAATGRLAWVSEWGRISEAMISPNGSKVVAVESDGTVHHARIRDGRDLRSWRIPDAPQSFVLSQDAELIASTNATAGRPNLQIVQIWDAFSGKLLAQFTDRKGSLVSFISNRRVATARSNSHASIWDIASGKRVLLLGRGQPESGSTQRLFLVVSPDGSRIAASDFIGQTTVWSAQSGRRLGKWIYTASPTDSDFLPPPIIPLQFPPTFSSDGRMLAFSSLGGTRVWQADGKRLISTLGGTFGVRFSPDGKHALTFGGNVAALSQIDGGKEVATFRGHMGEVLAGGFSKDGLRILTGSNDRTARVWDATQGNARVVFRKAFKRSILAGISPSGRLVALVGDEALVFDLERRRIVRELIAERDGAEAMAFDARDRILASALFTEDVLLLSHAITGAQIRIHKGVAAATVSREVRNMTFSSDGRVLALATAEGGLLLWDVKSGAITKLSSKISTDADFSPDGSRVAVAGVDSVDVWDRRTRKIVHTRPGNTEHLDWSRDGSTLVTGFGNAIHVLDGESLTQILTIFVGEGSSVQQLSISSDGNWVAANVGGHVRVWDSRTGALVQIYRSELLCCEGPISFLPGKTDVIAGETTKCCENEAAVAIFRCDLCASVDRLISIIQRRVTRPFSAEERRLFDL